MGKWKFDGQCKAEIIDSADKLTLIIHRHRETEGTPTYSRISEGPNKGQNDLDRPTGNFNVCTSGRAKALPSGMVFSWNLVRQGVGPTRSSAGITIKEG